ncbi:c-type cytochrome [Paenibacillus sp. CAU 1782]
MHKWIMAGLMSLAGLLAVILLLTAMPEKEAGEGGGTAFTVPEREVDAAASTQIYQSMCISCHGTDLQGGVGPALAHVGASMTKEQLYKIISGGRGVMPSFKDKLTEDEIITITTWLSSLQ